MQLDTRTQELGIRWFFCAGGFALLLAFALYTIDNKLSFSYSEKPHTKALNELRTAQSTLGSHSTDSRQTQSAIYELRAVPANAGADKSERDHHHEEHH